MQCMIIQRSIGVARAHATMLRFDSDIHIHSNTLMYEQRQVEWCYIREQVEYIWHNARWQSFYVINKKNIYIYFCWYRMSTNMSKITISNSWWMGLRCTVCIYVCVSAVKSYESLMLYHVAGNEYYFVVITRQYMRKDFIRRNCNRIAHICISHCLLYTTGDIWLSALYIACTLKHYIAADESCSFNLLIENYKAICWQMDYVHSIVVTWANVAARERWQWQFHSSIQDNHRRCTGDSIKLKTKNKNIEKIANVALHRIMCSQRGKYNLLPSLWWSQQMARFPCAESHIT